MHFYGGAQEQPSKINHAIPFCESRDRLHPIAEIGVKQVAPIRRKRQEDMESMIHSARVLSISDDDGLRYSREFLLSNDGYVTESITSNTALSVSRVRSFDIALICRSVEPKRAMALTDMLRHYNPEIQILCISPLDDRLDRCGADLEIGSGPEAVLEAVRALCNRRSAHKAYYEASHHG